MWKDEKGFIKRSVNCEEDFLYETGYDKNWINKKQAFRSEPNPQGSFVLLCCIFDPVPLSESWSGSTFNSIFPFISISRKIIL